MPSSSDLVEDVLCSACGARISDFVRFQWGGVPHLVEYKIGDRVEWMRDRQNEIAPPFTYGSWRGWNSGDPSFEDVIVLDMNVVNWEGIRCPKCQRFFPGVAVVVQGGKFQKVMVLDDAEMDRLFGASRGKADIVVVRPDGIYCPREDWFDHVLITRPMGKGSSSC